MLLQVKNIVENLGINGASVIFSPFSLSKFKTIVVTLDLHNVPQHTHKQLVDKLAEFGMEHKVNVNLIDTSSF